MPFGNISELVKLGALSVEGDWDNTPGFIRYRFGYFVRIDVEGIFFNVDEHRCRTKERNLFRRGDEGKIRDNNFISGSDTLGKKTEKLRHRGAGEATEDVVLRARVEALLRETADLAARATPAVEEDAEGPGEEQSQQLTR